MHSTAAWEAQKPLKDSKKLRQDIKSEEWLSSTTAFQMWTSDIGSEIGHGDDMKLYMQTITE